MCVAKAGSSVGLCTACQSASPTETRDYVHERCLSGVFKLLISVVVGLSTDLIFWFSCTVFFGVIYGNLIGTVLFLLLFHSHGGSLC